MAPTCCCCSSRGAWPDLTAGVHPTRRAGASPPRASNILDADNTFTLDGAAAAAASLTGTSTNGTTITPVPGIGAHIDWRLPTIVELLTIVDTTTVACQVGGPCIDPIFGTTVSDLYWASTTDNDGDGWLVSFQTGGLGIGGPSVMLHARPVRSAF